MKPGSMAQRVMLKILELHKAGQYICPQSLARAMNRNLAGHIYTHVRKLEGLGLIKRVHHTWHQVEILPIIGEGA